MIINRHNYELILIDFMEGNLSKEEATQVVSFLEANPDIKQEFDLLNESILPKEEVIFENKDLLKTSESSIEGITQFEQFSIAYLEKDSTKEEEKELFRRIENSSLKKQEHQLIQKTKLHADRDIIFPNKLKLKKYPAAKSRIIYLSISAMAASIAIILVLSFLFQPAEKQFALGINKNDRVIPNARTIVITEEAKIENNNTVVYQNSTAQLVNDTAIKKIDSNSIKRNEDIQFQIAGFRTINNIEIKETNIQFGDINLESNAQFAKIDENPDDINNYISKRLEELGISQQKTQSSKRSIVPIVRKSLFGFIGGKLKNKFKVNKTELEDGRRLYAIKAGSYELYANRPAKAKKKKNTANSN